MPEGFYDSKELMNNVISFISKNIDANKFHHVKTVYDEWEKILLSIKSTVLPEAGRKMLDHSEIIDIKDGIMVIEIDHPGWKQLFETYRNYILRGLKMKIPQITVDAITYRLKKGDTVIKSNLSTRNEKKSDEKVIIKTEKKEINHPTQEDSLQNNTAKEIHPELKKMFDSLREAMEKRQNNKEI